MVMAGKSAVLLAVLLVWATAPHQAAAGGYYSSTTFAVAGHKFKLLNRPVSADEGFVCPDAKPFSTVTFCSKGSSKLVKIVGNFEAAGVGICNATINPETLSPTTVVTYEQYFDTVILRIANREPAAFRALVVDGKNVGVGLSGEDYGVSTFVDAGPSKC